MPRFLLFAGLALLLACNNSVPEFDGQRSFAYLEKQVAFGPRVPGSEAQKACAEWLVDELGQYADRVVVQSFNHKDKHSGRMIPMKNIIASFNNKPRLKRIMLAAHWDSRPRADQDKLENQHKPIPGANDGASGVAVLLEIARALKKQPLSYGVDIVLFDGEDYGREGELDEYFIGARYFAENIGKYRPQYGILLDMVGDAQLSLPVEYNSVRAAPHVVKKVWDTAERLGYTAFEKRMGPAISDDHIPMIEAGIPFIDIIDFAYPDQGHAYWHTLQDTPDKCSPQSLKTVGQVLLHVLYEEEQ
ncbi:MAG TPA: M28 family peptidase [Caldithrix abyssi]|uniref:M28 family peptidase n=1 Tax=Caldithrix abyssi TaxID=187145 RepID=A0A7V1LND8_CALAY|nr:M28 family peptidase [Caldithrix abyssi]